MLTLLLHHQLQSAITATHLVCHIKYGNHVHTPRATGHINWCCSDQDLQPVDQKQQETTKRNQLEEKNSILLLSPHILQASDINFSQRNRKGKQETSTKTQRNQVRFQTQQENC